MKFMTKSLKKRRRNWRFNDWCVKKRTTILYINSNIYFHSFFKIIKKIKENKNKYKKIRINNENNLNFFYNKLDEIIKISNYMLISIESMTKIEY